MNKPKLTGWIDGNLKPVRVGVYYRKNINHPFSYWNGRCWGVSSISIQPAYNARNLKSVFQDISWRGLKEEPK